VDAVVAGTDSIEPNTVVKIPLRLSSRLTLELEVPIVRLGDSEITGFALYSDKTGAAASPQAFVEKAAEKWLASGSQALRFIENNSSSQSDVKSADGRAHFTGRILLNLDDCFANVGREVEKDKWNNVVAAADVSKYCGRNFAVAACRQNVLKQNGDGNFWANRDFQLYTDLTPTEQIFLTLYALVRTPNGCIDACTGKPVSKDDFDKASRTDCPLVRVRWEKSRSAIDLLHRCTETQPGHESRNEKKIRTPLEPFFVGSPLHGERVAHQKLHIEGEKCPGSRPLPHVSAFSLVATATALRRLTSMAQRRAELPRGARMEQRVWAARRARVGDKVVGERRRQAAV
jgi:hypothetical protein